MSNEIYAQQNVAELLARWPQVIPIFLRHRMSCVGCTMSRFENLGDVTNIYGLDLNSFLEEIRQAVQSEE